ncbi:MAG: heat shock protein Hsp20 [Pseudomonadota bacterium]|jgi:HSP20 family protein
MLWARERDLGGLFEPFWQFRTIEERMNDLLGTPRVDAGAPPMNVWVSDERAVIAASLPGLSAETIDVRVDGRNVTIQGEYGEPIEEGKTLARRERARGTFSRSFELPFGLDPDTVSAEYRAGILQVTLPRLESERSRRIAIRT